VKHQLVKNLMFQEAVVLMIAIKSAHKMARALRVAALVTEMTAPHLVPNLLSQIEVTAQRRIVSVLVTMNLLATVHHATHQAK
jgi:hypothetical protein